MAWFSGQATDYRDMLSKLADYASNSNVQTVAISAAGTGYVAGEIVTISGGTAVEAARVEIETVGGGGEVTSARISHAGAYTSNPSSPAATTGGSGSGFTATITLGDTGWSILRETQDLFVLDDNLIASAGTGYAVNDILTVDASGVAGTTATTNATLIVTSIGGSGEVTGLRVTNPGEYTAIDNAADHPLTGGGGSGVEITLFSSGVIDESELLLEGIGAGSDEIYIGMRTYSTDITGGKNWELAGFTGFEQASSFSNQPSISPGRYDNQGLGSGGNYFPLQDVAFNYWLSISSRRILLVCQTGTAFHSAYLGFIDAYSTDTAYPYPLFISGSTTDYEQVFSDTDIGSGCFLNPIANATSHDIGPGTLRSPSGAWLQVSNGRKDGSTINIVDESVNTWPSERSSIPASAPNQWASDNEIWVKASRFTELDPGGSVTLRIEPTPNSGGALSPLLPITLYDSNAPILLGQLSDVYWVSASRDGASSATSNDTFTLANGNRLRMFQNITRTDIYDYFCMLES